MGNGNVKRAVGGWVEIAMKSPHVKTDNVMSSSHWVQGSRTRILRERRCGHGGGGSGHEADSVEMESVEVEGREWMVDGDEGMEMSSGDHERSEVMRREMERDGEGERERAGEGMGPGRAGSVARAYSMRLGRPSASGSARARDSEGSGASGKWR
jgi:hypothetical protein